MNGSRVHHTIVREMLATALTGLTSQPTTVEAWQAILGSNEMIGIKFNRSGQAILGTTPAVANALIESLIDAGYSPDQIVCIEAPRDVERRFGTMPARVGYEVKPTDFGSGADQLALVLGQVTRLINVPFLKSHNIAGMTGCLKNLSHGLIKHPARYHANGCSPYVADIAALEAIRGKLRLCLVDALRVPYAGGPEPQPASTTDTGVLLASQDPVAADFIGLSLLNEIRQREGFPPVTRSGEHLPYLAQAHRGGLGIAVLGGIDVVHSVP